MFSYLSLPSKFNINHLIFYRQKHMAPIVRLVHYKTREQILSSVNLLSYSMFSLPLFSVSTQNKNRLQYRERLENLSNFSYYCAYSSLHVPHEYSIRVEINFDPVYTELHMLDLEGVGGCGVDNLRCSYLTVLKSYACGSMLMLQETLVNF